MEILGIIGILLGVLAIILFIVRGLNLVVAAPLATLIVLLFNEGPILESLFGTDNSYMVHLSSFIAENFAIFLIGSIFAKYMDKSGATTAIAQKIISFIGTDRPYSGMVALFIICALLTLGGINVFVIVFAVVPFARSLFKELNLSWKLVAAPIFAGTSTFTMTMFPGTPSLQNIVPSNSLGTPLTAAPVIGLVASAVSIVFTLIFLKVVLNRSLKRGETFDAEDDRELENESEMDYPSFLASLTPIIVLLATILLFSNVWNYVVIIALTLATLVAVFLFRKQIPVHKTLLNKGAQESMSTAFTTASTIAFGSVTVGVPAFSGVFNALLSIPGNPLLSLSIATMIVSGITGSAVGSAGIAVESFAPVYLEMGIGPEVVHRIITISSGALGLMPHTGMAIIFNRLCNLSMKDTFKYQFTAVNVNHWVVLILIFVLFLFV